MYGLTGRGGLRRAPPLAVYSPDMPWSLHVIPAVIRALLEANASTILCTASTPGRLHCTDDAKNPRWTLSFFSDLLRKVPPSAFYSFYLLVHPAPLAAAPAYCALKVPGVVEHYSMTSRQRWVTPCPQAMGNTKIHTHI